MAIRVGGRPGLGTLGEQVLLLGRTHIVGQVGAPRVARQGRGIPGRLTPGNIAPSRPDWVTPGRTCPGISVRTSTPSSLPKDFAPMAGMSRRQLGRFAALPPAFNQREYGGNVGVFADRPLEGGQHYWVGPFLLQSGRTEPFSVNVSVADLRNRADFNAFLSFVSRQLRDLSRKAINGVCTGNTSVSDHCGAYKEDGSYWGVVPSNYLDSIGKSIFPSFYGDWKQGTKSRCLSTAYTENTRVVGSSICVPDGDFWYAPFYKGTLPIAKYKHPATGKQWGVFLTIQGLATNHPERWVFTFKPYADPPGWLSQLWNWLIEIVVDVVETVVDVISSIISGLLKYACSQAQTILIDVQNAAKNKTALSASTTNSIVAKTPLTAITLATLISGGTGVGVKAAADAIITGFCGSGAGSSPPMETTEEDVGAGVGLVVAGLGAAGILAYFLLR